MPLGKKGGHPLKGTEYAALSQVRSYAATLPDTISSHLSEERGLLRKYRLSQAYIS